MEASEVWKERWIRQTEVDWSRGSRGGFGGEGQRLDQI
jgi:hypothetical protein